MSRSQKRSLPTLCKGEHLHPCPMSEEGEMHVLLQH